jgi:hypothetical protein
VTNDADQSFQPKGDVDGGHAEARLEVIGAQHDDDGIKRRVAFQKGGQDGQAIAMRAFNGVIVHGCPPRLAFDNYFPSGQLGGEMGGPAVSPCHAAALAQGGYGKGAVGIAVTKKHDAAHD